MMAKHSDGVRYGMTVALIWCVWWLCLWPILAVGRAIYKLTRLGRSFLRWLNHLDPMPWNQAVLLGLAFATMIALAVFGSYVD